MKLVSASYKFECSINMTNHIFILHAMELARAKGWPADQGGQKWLGFCTL